MANDSKALLCILGGSFNPPHIGHLRNAIEIYEQLEPEKLLLIPCASPPHKPGQNLLPFEFRAEMLEACLTGLDGIEVSRIEGERPGPSYTVDTLSELSRIYPEHRLGFIMGDMDLPQLPIWSRWQTIPELTDLLVLTRGEHAFENFSKNVLHLWPDATKNDDAHPSFSIPGKGRIFFIAQPRLEISSSMIRERWLEGKNVDFLVPAAVSGFLEANRGMVEKTWGAFGR